MKRQIVLFALVVVLIPFFAAFGAEPPGKVWKIGNLVSSTPSVNAPRDEALRQRLREKRGARLSPPRGLAAFDFTNGTLLWTEAGSKKRASLHVVAGETGLSALDPGGIEVLDSDLASFSTVLTSANHTLKRALTDPRLFSGIGNAYSDEILFEARLSPLLLTHKLKP